MLPFTNYYISTIPIMSEKKNITRSNRNWRKKRWPTAIFTGGGGGGRGGDDKLATVKAAAWAWYQRHEEKPMMREFELTTRSATRTPRPSRFKLEANKNMIISKTRVSKPYNNHLLLGDQETKFSSLLDPYEIKSISKRIEEGSLPTSAFRYDHGHHYDHVTLEKKLEYDSKKENGLVKKVRFRDLWKGMNLMAPRTVCGRSDDVDLGAYRAGPRIEKVSPKSVNIRTDRRSIASSY